MHSMLARGAFSGLLSSTLARISPAAQLSLDRQSSSAAASTSAAPSDADKLAGLTEEQRKHLQVIQYLAQRPLAMAHSASVLAVLTATYRDLYVVMDAMHKKDILGIPRPLVEDPAPAAATGASDSSSSGGASTSNASGSAPAINSTQSFYPIRDFTQLPDPPDSGLDLKKEYMGRQPAWQQLLPNHLEVSYQLNTFIYLWPAMESYMPLFVDFTDIQQLLNKRVKRGRSGARRRRKPKPHTNLRHFYNSPDLR